MAKGWTEVSCNTKVVSDKVSSAEKFSKARGFDRTMVKMKTLSADELKKESEKRYADKVKRDEEILDAFSKKKLKSKALIKRAKALIKERQKAEAEAKAKAVKEKSAKVEATT